MTTVKKLHEQYNKYPEYNKFHLSFQYDRKIKNWKFLGYRCVHCNKTFVRADTIPSHTIICRALPNSNRKIARGNSSLEEQQIIDVNRNKWQPYDFNQKNSSDE